MGVHGASEANSITDPMNDQYSEQYVDWSNEETDEDTRLLIDQTA